MSSHCRSIAIALSLSLLAAVAAVAQPPAASHFYVIHQEHAKPSKIQQYEAGAKDFAAMVQAHHDAIPTFSYVVTVEPDFTYTYVAPIPNFAGVDAINAGFGPLAAQAGDQFAALMGRWSETVTGNSEMVVAYMPELSYQPAAPRLKPEEARYAKLAFYALEPGHEEEADAIARDYAALYKAKGITTGYQLYKVVMGPDMPALVVRIPAKDPADWYAADQKAQELTGAEGQALAARALAITRHFDMRESWRRPDLDLPAMAAKP